MTMHLYVSMSVSMHLHVHVCIHARCYSIATALTDHTLELKQLAN